jgi:hypothetical protein
MDRDVLRDSLSNSIMTITFLKKDGCERVMKCTLKSDLLPKVEVPETKTPRKENLSTLSVFDLEKNDWRSIILENIISTSNAESL